jgi:crossover junction endodeoxyribonuclease RuvC
MVRAGIIRTSPNEDIPRRLERLYGEVRTVLHDTRPQAMAIERVFFNINVRTAMGVGQAAGVAMLAAQQAGIAVFEYTPTRMKAVVTGTGAADKGQVAYMVQTHLRLAEIPQPADAADALALALCHLWDGDATTGAGMSPRLAAAVEVAGPGAQVVNAAALVGRGRGTQ